MRVMITLYNEDCKKTLFEIPEKSVNFILTDMPYGVTQNKKDVRLSLDLVWDGIWRVAKENACVALFGQGLFYVDIVNSQRKYYKYDYVWDKVLTSGFLNARKMPLRRTERVAIFYKSQSTYNPQMTYGEPLHSKGNPQKHTNNNYGKHGLTDDRKGAIDKYPTDLLKFSKPHPSVSVHPTQKSVELCKWLIKTYTNEGDTVLDFCMGSGTTGIAASETGRNFIGVEMDTEFFKIAEKRINDVQTALW